MSYYILKLSSAVDVLQRFTLFGGVPFLRYSETIFELSYSVSRLFTCSVLPFVSRRRARAPSFARIRGKRAIELLNPNPRSVPR